MATPSIAANAYASLARIATPGGGASGIGAGATPAAGGASFGDMLKEAVGSVLDSGRTADAQSMKLAAGKSNIMDVVTAVAETDVAVSTLVSVRDRVIQSYEDIMRMPI
jgi:flagellar hook-basal body complex protein FliE